MEVLEDTPTARDFNLYHPANPVAIASDITLLRYEEETGFGTMLVDANNSFNKLSRYVMLWHCRHAWPHASHFAFNRYRHFNIVIFQNGPGEDPCIILSQEGIAQGDVFGLSLDGVTPTPYANTRSLQSRSQCNCHMTTMPAAREMPSIMPSASPSWFGMVQPLDTSLNLQMRFIFAKGMIK